MLGRLLRREGVESPHLLPCRVSLAGNCFLSVRGLSYVNIIKLLSVLFLANIFPRF